MVKALVKDAGKSPRSCRAEGRVSRTGTPVTEPRVSASAEIQVVPRFFDRPEQKSLLRAFLLLGGENGTVHFCTHSL